MQVTLQQQTSELAVLREQCSNHAKERAALKTILDAKIKALVDDIGHSVADIPQEVCCCVHFRTLMITLGADLILARRLGCHLQCPTMRYKHAIKLDCHI